MISADGRASARRLGALFPGFVAVVPLPFLGGVELLFLAEAEADALVDVFVAGGLALGLCLQPLLLHRAGNLLLALDPGVALGAALFDRKQFTLSI